MAASLIACAHKKPPPPPPPPPPAKVEPKGEKLRFKGAAGDVLKGSVKLLIEQEAGGKKRVFNVSFSSEEKIDSVGDGGVMMFTVRLVDAVGTVEPAGRKPAEVKKEQEQVDDFALALDDLKIQYRRAPTGDVGALQFTGLHKPLDEGTARGIFGALYGAGRGSLFPEEPVEPGATWKGAAPLPAGVGAVGSWAYTYSFRSLNEGTAFVMCEGAIDAKGPTLKLTGTSNSSYRFDVTAGHLKSTTFDGKTENTQTAANAAATAVSSSQHIHIEWLQEDAAADQQPAAATTK